jgi:succinate dehydrogenase/fumarate reductase-like Fe-S protein
MYLFSTLDQIKESPWKISTKDQSRTWKNKCRKSICPNKIKLNSWKNIKYNRKKKRKKKESKSFHPSLEFQ